MNRLDVYYRALRAYRGVTANRQCEDFRRVVAEANTENDEITVSRNICTVEEDWMDAIEAGLVFVEKAIREERQFIHSNGEVLPIEKVKHVSKESVQHLARHSNLITKERRGEDMIPDHLYSVEKLNDYAVYENRFLYMLLCYLRDFITLRYEKVLELSACYDGTLRMNKQIVYRNQKITYSVDLHDERKNDKILLDGNPAKGAIDRMDLLLKAVLALLATPLMEIAGKAPKLKPPITKTNVLKMDNNFRGAMALYEYVVAYEKLGYSVEPNSVQLAPFSETLADELSEASGMLMFLTYEYGLDLNDTLKARFIEAENREREEQIRRKERQIAFLKKKLAAKEITPEEYILELEGQVRLLESDNRRIPSLKAQIEALTEKDERSQAEILSLTEQTRRLGEQISEAAIAHEKEKTEMRAAHEEQLYQLVTCHEADLSDLKAKCEERIRENDARRAEEMRVREETMRAEREQLEGKLSAMDARYGKELSILRDDLRRSESILGQVVGERNRLSEENVICKARIHALQAQSGASFEADAFTEKEDFNELERELEAFVKFYEARWRITKKSIRKKLLSYQSLKGRNGQK